MISNIRHGILFITLILFYSCQNNPTGDTAQYTTKDSLYQEEKSLPVAVSEGEMCRDFSSNAGHAITKYKDNILVLSGTVYQTQSPAGDCNYITMMCSSTKAADTSSLVIKCCIQDIRRTDTFAMDRQASIRCRFIEFKNNVILLEEVVM